MSMSLTKRNGVNRSAQRGFTLVELLITVAIIGILAAIAYPNYNDYMTKSRRAEAKTLLSDIAARQEQYFLDNRRYTNNLADLRYATNTDGSVNSEKAYYAVSVDPATFTTTSYLLTAVPDPAGAQASDPCGTLTLTEAGVRGHAVGGENCW